MKQKINYQLLAIIGVILVLNVIFSPPSVPRRLQIKEGEIATVDVIAPYDFSIPKTEQELNDERADIARRIHPTYELDNTLYPRTEKRIADLGRIVDAHKGNRLGRDSLFSILQREYRISESIIEYLRRNDHRAILRRIENTLADLYADGIVDTKPVGHSIITIMSGDQELVESVDQLYSLAEAESMAASSGKVEYRQLLASFIAPNIIFNQVKTELLINEVFANVPRTKGKILKGELIVEKHKRIPEGTLEKIFALENTFGSIGAWEIIRVVLFRNLLYFSIIFLLYHFNKITRVPLAQSRSIYYIALLSTIYLILGKIVLETDTVFLLPIAFFVFLFAVYFNLSTAIVLTIVLSGLMALMANSLSIFVYLFVSGIVGVFSSQTINSRLSLYRPLLYIAIANVVAIMFVDLYLAKTPLSFLDLGEGVLNGILVSVSVALFLPLFERLFDFTTDLTLLELGNLNLPLFKEMSIEVPGTYHHSIVVGNLAEAGASVIGADPILARVGSYYHDIGKLKKPEYFIENQIGLKNG